MKMGNLPLWHVVVSIPGVNIDKYILSETEPTLEQIQAVWDADGGSATKVKPRGWSGPLSEAYPGVGLVERLQVADLRPRRYPAPEPLFFSREDRGRLRSNLAEVQPFDVSALIGDCDKLEAVLDASGPGEETTPEWDKLCARLFDDPSRRLEHLHIEWGTEAGSLPREELCRALNESMDRMEAGALVAGPPVSAATPTDVRALAVSLDRIPAVVEYLEGEFDDAPHRAYRRWQDDVKPGYWCESGFRAGYAAGQAAAENNKTGEA